MGFFDRFKKAKPEEEKIPPRMEQEPISPQATVATTEDGMKLFEYYDPRRVEGKFYDTTRLAVARSPRIIAGKAVYECRISWYGENDTVYFDTRTGRRNDFRSIFAGINPEQMERDPMYLDAVMTRLLDQTRVERYLDRRFMTEEELKAKSARTGEHGLWPGGRYVGFMKQQEDGSYAKAFDVAVGRACHNLPEMVEEREKHREQVRRAREAEIARRQAELDKMKASIDDYER